MKFAEGMTIYTCFKDCREYHIGVATVEDVIQEYTPNGRARKPKYRLSLKNFTRDGKSEAIVNETYIEPYHASAVDAVHYALQDLFYILDRPSAEERILRCVCGEPPCRVTEANLSEVIDCLISIEKVFALAHRIDAESAERKRKGDVE